MPQQAAYTYLQFKKKQCGACWLFFCVCVVCFLKKNTTALKQMIKYVYIYIHTHIQTRLPPSSYISTPDQSRRKQFHSYSTIWKPVTCIQYEYVDIITLEIATVSNFLVHVGSQQFPRELSYLQFRPTLALQTNRPPAGVSPGMPVSHKQQPGTCQLPQDTNQQTEMPR